MNKLYGFALTLLAILCADHSFCQISFTNQTQLLNNPDDFTSGNVLAISDMNADGLDDIIRLDNGSMLSIEYQTPNSEPFGNYSHGNVPSDAWAIVVGDANNDGYCDIMVGGAYDGVKLLWAMDDGAFYLSSTLPGPGLFVQGSNMADINNDGYLDVFACHDDGESRIWENTQNSSFVQADQWIDMKTDPVSDNSGNYGSVWTDFDNDGDLDLYIAKCRIGVTSQDDPRRINALFVNDGENNFHEAAEEYGLKIRYQSWTSDFQDIDNDGDLDCFVTNHDSDLQLLENDGTGHFTDISVTAGIAKGNGSNFVQGIMKDFDNDGFVDIITAQPTLFFRNNGDKTFTEMSPFAASFGSLATGDLNHDGFVDLYVSYQNGFNNPSNTPDKLWINDGNDNHFLSVKLEGVQSNKMGVGARIEIHGSWGIQIREVRAGESYGIMNSLTQSFGLADETEIDYVVVKWPSGTVDVLRNVAADQFISIVEGSTCELPPFQLQGEESVILCGIDSITLEAPSGYTYLWNDGSTDQSITIYSPGNYNVVIVDDQGCAAGSATVKVFREPDQTPTIAVIGDTSFCEGGSVELVASASFTDVYPWSTGDTTAAITVTQTGDYQVVIEGICSTFPSETIHVEVLEKATEPVADNVTVVAPSTAILEATGENPHWFETINSPTPLAIGDQFETPVLTETTTYFVAGAKEYGGGSATTGMPEHQGGLYSSNESNGQVRFEVYNSIILKQVTVSTDSVGVRIIELLDQNNQVLQSMAVDLPVGESVIDLNFAIDPGTYRLTTNGPQNVAVFGPGNLSPWLTRSNEGVSYPYEVPGTMSITGSNFGAGFYYYFFNWQIEKAPTKCFSERVEVTVNVEPNATKEVSPFGKLSVMPNPSTGLFTLEMEAFETGVANLIITDITGKQIWRDQFSAIENALERRQVDLGGVPAGMYFLKITSGERASWLKLVVQ
ncbi:MAG: FG-GAP-like repeat-containing protein [Saprospiraceae bacterium]